MYSLNSFLRRSSTWHHSLMLMWHQTEFYAYCAVCTAWSRSQETDTNNVLLNWLRWGFIKAMLTHVSWFIVRSTSCCFSMLMTLSWSLQQSQPSSGSSNLLSQHSKSRTWRRHRKFLTFESSVTARDEHCTWIKLTTSRRCFKISTWVLTSISAQRLHWTDMMLFALSVSMIRE